jgi:DNA-directed RNA polymerase specialized sigma24 family protein
MTTTTNTVFDTKKAKTIIAQIAGLPYYRNSIDTIDKLVDTERLLKQLPKDLYQVVYCRYVLGNDITATAKRLDLSVSTIKNKSKAALQILINYNEDK